MSTLPFDFDIFLRSGSRTQPEIAALRQGRASCRKWARTTVENSQVRMISWACGRTSIGKTRSKRSGSSCQPPAICGESDEVAQVSITSGSPAKPPGSPRCSGVKPGGVSDDGSIGSAGSSARIGLEWSTVPSPAIGYQTGNGTPKKRCRLMHQSWFRPSTQFS